MSTLEYLKPILIPEGRIRGFLVLVLIILLVVGDYIVEHTGGTSFAFVHIMYIPILLGGYIFGIPGGILTGFAAGFLMGPLIPTNIPNDLHQPLSSWLIRMGMYMFVGALAGGGTSILKAYVQDLEARHITDPLTGLPNLYGLLQCFQQFCQESSTTLILVEFARLSEITQALGTEKLNSLIHNLGQILKETLGESTTVGYLPTQQFVILIPEIQEKEVLQQCEELAMQSFSVQDIPIFLDMRFGLAHCPQDDKDLNQLIQKARLALKKTESFGERANTYKQETKDPSERNLTLLHHFEKALRTEKLYLEYQPQVNLQTGELKGFEALVRWKDPTLGLIRPDEFIPLIEETLYIRPYSLWLIKTVLAQLMAWEQAGFQPHVSLNLSTENLFDPEVKHAFLDLLKAAKIKAYSLGVEVTETAVASNFSVIVEALTEFRKAGVTVSIDDYGTGQASQQYLFEFPLDGLKIDKIFVRALEKTPAAKAIVKNAISLAKEMNLEVVAEGIETKKQLDQLKAWGCQVGQGHYFSASLNVEEATRWLEKKSQAKAIP